MGQPRFHLICNIERNRHRRAAVAYAERRDDENHDDQAGRRGSFLSPVLTQDQRLG